MAAMLLFLYAATLLAGGAWAYFNAPAGANATTALAVPGAMALLVIIAGLMAMQIATRRFLGRLGVWLGLGLALLFTAALMVQGVGAAGQVGNYNDTVQKFTDQQSALGAAALTGAERDAALAKALEEAKAPSHDKTYLRNTLLGLGAVSLLVAGGMFLLRPRQQPRG